MSLEGKVAIVTGGANGIGRAVAFKLAQHGVKVSLCDVDVADGQVTADMINEQGGKAIFTKCDVAKAAEVEAMVRATVDAFGGLDIAVNNAGVGGDLRALHELNESIWDHTHNINLKGVWLCMKYEIPHMIERGGGSIINTASVAGLIGFQGNAVYAASKHGVIGLTKSAALEYARYGIRVNAICPGFTETEMVTNMIDLEPRMAEGVRRASPMRRMGHVDEIADAVVYLAGDTASFVTGHALTIDGGATAQ